MNFTEIKERLQQVLQIVEESEYVAQLSDLERDLALQNLREVYSVLRFGAVEPSKVEVDAEPKAVEVEVAPEPIVVEVAPEPIAVEVVEPIVVEPTPQPVVEEVVEVEPIVEPAVEPIVVVEEQPVIEEQPVAEEPKSVDSEVEALKTRKSAMYALYEESAPAPTLGDTFGEKRALADMIAAPKGVAESRQVESLASAIGVADRFMLIRELFDNDEVAYQSAIEQLDSFGSFDDCMVYIAENFSWRASSDGAKYMMELLQRKYNA